MNRQTLLLTAATAFLAVSVAGASEIYKWTDAEGNVHYEDRPTGSENVERVAIASARTNNETVKARVDARVEARKAREEAAANAAGGSDDEAEEPVDKAEQCSKYRARLESYLRSQRLYREGDDGERVYLDESQILAARARVEDKVKEYCN